FFLGDPQGWKGPVIAYPGGADALAAAAAQAGVGLYVHAPYVINVATTNNRIRIPSRKLLQQTLDAAAAITARGVVVHGAHVLPRPRAPAAPLQPRGGAVHGGRVLKNDDPHAGFDTWRKCVERLEIRCPLLIENTAGGDNAMARRLERIARLWEAVSAADTD